MGDVSSAARRFPGYGHEVTIPLFGIGFISLLGQVVLLREINVAFYGIELIYILAMGIWMFWTAVGAVFGRWTYIPKRETVGGLFILFAATLPLEIACVRNLRNFLGGVPGTYLDFDKQWLFLILILLPVNFLLGLLFQWTAKLYIETENETLAKAYAIESAGGLVGGLIATAGIKFGIQNLTLGLIGGLAAALIGIFRIDSSWRRFRRRPVRCGVQGFLLVLLVSAIPFSDSIDFFLSKMNHPFLIDTRDSPYGRVTISEREGQFVIYENDVLIFESQTVDSETFVHLAALQRDDIRNVLIAGGGVGEIVGEILKHCPASVDYVEIDRVLLNFTEKYLPDQYRRALDVPRVNVHIDDPVRFLRHSKTYDLILSGASEPISGLTNRFFTVEYFQKCAQKLSEDGVLAFRLNSPENIWTHLTATRNAGIYKALNSVFKEIVILPGLGAHIVMASRSTLERTPGTIIRRFEIRNLSTRLVTPPFIRYLYTNDRFLSIEKRMKETQAPVNTDMYPVCYFYDGMIWLSKFSSEVIHFDTAAIFNISDGVRRYFPILLVGIIGGFLIIRRWFSRFRTIMLVFTAAFIGMVIETILLMMYQSWNGALFQNIGLLLTLFMAGLMAGGMLISKMASVKAADRMFRPAAVFFVAMLLGLELTVLWMFGADTMTGWFSIGCLLFISGVSIAGIFSISGICGVSDRKRVVSPLYASDLVGGCLGSLVASLVMIPLFGMSFSMMSMALITVALIALI